MGHAYTAIGRAVFAAQLFETVLVPVFEFFKMSTEPGYLEETGGFVRAGAFRIPVKAIVNTLKAHGQLAPDLESRLSAYVDDRNILIHRWIMEHGWPDEGDVAGFAPVMELAQRVEREARALTLIFANYMVKFASPDWAVDHPVEYRERVAAMFQRAHIDTATSEAQGGMAPNPRLHPTPADPIMSRRG
jgi:hypothetical protein